MSEAPDTPRVLLLEDSPSDADLVEMGLADAGEDVELVKVERLSEARTWLASSTASCALVDLSLPDAEGIEVVLELRQIAPELPLVVLSGGTDEAVALRAVREGAQDYLLKGEATGGSIARAIRYAVERKRSEIDLTYRAFHDPLTGLGNRTLLVDRIEHALCYRERYGSAVLFLDLDGFKPINDRLGHAIGDRVLIEVAGRLGSLLRPSDTKARLGGDEFVVLCEQIDPEDARRVAERLVTEIGAPMQIEGHELSVSVSLGMAFPSDGRDASEVLAAADRAMYRAKAEGGGVVTAPGAVA